MDDPDAPDPRAPRTIWVHWVVFDIPSEVAEKLELHLVSTMDEVLKIALVSPVTPLPEEDGGPMPKGSDDADSKPLTH